MTEKIKKQYRMKIRARDCEKVFMENQDPGVVAFKEIYFNVTEKEAKHPCFTMALIRSQDAFLNEMFYVTIEEIDK